MYCSLRAALVVAACLPTISVAQVQPVALEDAIRRTLAASPQSASTSARVEALTAARTAAGLGPQPTVEVQIENFGPPVGNLYDQFQVTGTYSQRIERGGKRDARVAVADREIDVARAEAIVGRLDIVAQVHKLYVETQAPDAAAGVARQRLASAREVEREVGRRVASARDPVFAGTRAKTATAEAQVDVELAIHAHEAAIRRLAAMWRGQGEPVAVAAGDFLSLEEADEAPPPSPADTAVIEAQGARAGAAIDLQRANAVRDPTVSAGPRVIATGDVGLVAGVSLPIGGRRLAQTRIAEAEAERRRITADLAVDRFNRERAIALAAEKVEESRHEALAIRDTVVPNAERTLGEVRHGYNRGFFAFADVSAAQTTLTNARARMIDAARRYHEARVELDRLTGRFTALAKEILQ